MRADRAAKTIDWGCQSFDRRTAGCGLDDELGLNETETDGGLDENRIVLLGSKGVLFRGVSSEELGRNSAPARPADSGLQTGVDNITERAELSVIEELGCVLRGTDDRDWFHVDFVGWLEWRWLVVIIVIVNWSK